MLKLNDRVRAKDISSVGSLFRGLTGTIRHVRIDGRCYVEFDDPPVADTTLPSRAGNFTCQGGIWSIQSLVLISEWPLSHCAECEVGLDKIDYLCDNCRYARSR